jgi:hypothetical protein
VRTLSRLRGPELTGPGARLAPSLLSFLLTSSVPLGITKQPQVMLVSILCISRMSIESSGTISGSHPRSNAPSALAAFTSEYCNSKSSENGPTHPRTAILIAPIKNPLIFTHVRVTPRLSGRGQRAQRAGPKIRLKPIVMRLFHSKRTSSHCRSIVDSCSALPSHSESDRSPFCRSCPF